MRALLLEAKRGVDSSYEYLRREAEVKPEFKRKLHLRIKGKCLWDIQSFKTGREKASYKMLTGVKG